VSIFCDLFRTIRRTVIITSALRKFELVTVMARRKLLPEGFELCMCDVVHEILYDKVNYHLYFKYLRNLELSDVNLNIDVVTSFGSIMNNMEPSKGGVNTQLQVQISSFFLKLWFLVLAALYLLVQRIPVIS
jgi:hypothetical protein